VLATSVSKKYKAFYRQKYFNRILAVIWRTLLVTWASSGTISRL